MRPVKGKTVYVVYDVVEKSEPIVALGTIDEVTMKVKASRRTLWYSAKTGRIMNRRYKAFKVGKENEIDKEE